VNALDLSKSSSPVFVPL